MQWYFRHEFYIYLLNAEMHLYSTDLDFHPVFFAEKYKLAEPNSSYNIACPKGPLPVLHCLCLIVPFPNFFYSDTTLVSHSYPSQFHPSDHYTSFSFWFFSSLSDLSHFEHNKELYFEDDKALKQNVHRGCGLCSGDIKNLPGQFPVQPTLRNLL